MSIAVRPLRRPMANASAAVPCSQSGARESRPVSHRIPPPRQPETCSRRRRRKKYGAPPQPPKFTSAAAAEFFSAFCGGEDNLPGRDVKMVDSMIKFRTPKSFM
jgi:hypothetical protein